MPVTIVEETHGSIKKIIFSWTSDALGAATGTTEKAYNGEILRFATVPGAAALQPTDLYDIVINDEDGIDVLGGAGADQSNATTQQDLNTGCVANDKLTLVVANAGNAKSGTAYLYIR